MAPDMLNCMLLRIHVEKKLQIWVDGIAQRQHSRFQPGRPGFESDHWKKLHPSFCENLPL